MPPGPWSSPNSPGMPPDFGGKDGGPWESAPLMPDAEQDFRWSEGKSTAGLLQACLKVLKAENSGMNPGVKNGPAMQDPMVAGDFGDEGLGRLDYFNQDDFVIEITNDQPWEWTIVVHSSHENGPLGTYHLYSDGSTYFESE